MTWYSILRKYIAVSCALAASPCLAQEAAPPIVFQSGTGNAPVAQPVYVKPPRAEISCDMLTLAERAIGFGYYGEFELPRQRLDPGLFSTAVSKFREHHCSFGRSSGPAVIVIVDFARHSSEPRLYRVDLRSGEGIDSPIRVAHGIGSDPDDDGYASVFSNVQDSLTSSLGAARGGERYVGINGLSLRLDGLEPSNNQMRARDIVVHSYTPERRRYFNADLIAARGRPGSSEGCFVVEPDKREWILETLENGGFLYAGFSGKLPQPIVPVANPNVIFARGTGTSPAVAPAIPAAPPVSEIAAGTPGSPPTNPISPEPAASGR